MKIFLASLILPIEHKAVMTATPHAPAPSSNPAEPDERITLTETSRLLTLALVFHVVNCIDNPLMNRQPVTAEAAQMAV